MRRTDAYPHNRHRHLLPGTLPAHGALALHVVLPFLDQLPRESVSQSGLSTTDTSR